MENMRQNEDIRAEMQEIQLKLQKKLAECCATFELHPEINTLRQQIDALRKECTHLNTNHEIELYNGRCIYCGKKM